MTRSAVLAVVSGALSAEQERGFLWAPAFVAAGVLAFFVLPAEPPIGLCAAIAALGALACAATRFARSADGARLALWCAALLCIGFCAAAVRTHTVAAYVLEYRYYGPVEGRVVALDRSSSGALRVTLDQVVLGDRPQWKTPQRVRVSLYGTDAELRPVAGSRVMTTAHLSPPNGPAEPRGFDFRRHAWFIGLGGVGYTRLPLLLADAEAGRQGMFALRLALSDRVRAVLPGQTGAFAAALMSGDRSALSPQTLTNLRETNLAHLLAISGLHMGLLAGFVFAALRLVLGLVPRLAHGPWVKKIAALGALAAASGYLGLSGGSIATERAFIMASVALGAIMLDRRAISLRAVALAAMILMLLHPEAVVSPGFQMSFAATTALVVTFQLLTRKGPAQTTPQWIWRAVTGTFISSAVAGLATMPIAAAHFNHISHYGLIANLAATPLMGIWIMPLAVIAVALMPLGWDGPVLKLMGLGLDWILGVAASVADWPGAVSKLPAPLPWSFLLICFGMVILAIAATRIRWLGAALFTLGIAGWLAVTRPDVLIAANGTLVGVQTADGRALSKAKGAGFVAGIWLENDGDKIAQWEAAARWTQSWQEPAPVMRVAEFGNYGGQIFAAPGKNGLRDFDTCQRGDIAVFSERAPPGLACRVFDKDTLQQTGAVALYLLGGGGVKTVTARKTAGRRIWNTHDLRTQRLRWMSGFQ